MPPVKPNFLIIGAAKSGTTSLYEYLRKHPDVFMPEWKEPAFFAPPEAGGITDERDYLKLFENAAGKKIIGEASVAYLYAENAPEKIKSLLGKDVKIIILLREPGAMAYSNWGHQVREGFETLPFEKAIEKESERLADPDFFKNSGTWAANLAYLARARYKVQIEQYDALFPAANIKIYIYEEFFRPGLPLWNDLCAFLGINAAFRPEEVRHNKAGRVRSKGLRNFLNHPSALKTILKTFVPQSLRHPLRVKLEKANRKDEEMKSMGGQTRGRLQTLFSHDIDWLERRLGQSLKNLWY